MDDAVVHGMTCPHCGGALLEYVHHVAGVTGPRRTRFECVGCDWTGTTDETALPHGRE